MVVVVVVVVVVVIGGGGDGGVGGGGGGSDQTGFACGQQEILQREEDPDASIVQNNADVSCIHARARVDQRGVGGKQGARH